MSAPETLRSRITDRLYSQSPEATAGGAFAVLNAIQYLGSPAAQVLALACAYRNICEVLSIGPMDTLRVVERMERDCRYRQVNTLSAVRAYTEHELLPHFP